MESQIHYTDYTVLLPLFNSLAFRAFIAAHSDSFSRVGDTLGHICRLICLRRVKGQEHPKADGGVEIICGDLKAPLVGTLLLRMTASQAKVYRTEFSTLTNALYGAGTKKKGQLEGIATRNMSIHRLLCHLTQNPMAYFLGSGFHAADVLNASTNPVQAFRVIDKYTNRVAIRGFSGMFPPLRDRTAAAQKIMQFSPKHAALGVLINNICFRQEKKLLVFESWPVSQFLTETLLGLLDIPYKSMRADHDAKTREQIVEEFNNPEDPDLLLIVTLK
jgi:hypothetical protein